MAHPAGPDRPARPQSISGGCLCGRIRFTVAFPSPSDWPPTTNGYCQCTMCRKHSGALLPQNCGFPTAHVSPPFASHASYRTFRSSATAERGFCATCGSPLTFQERGSSNVEINLGAFDEEVLCGARDEAAAWEDELGRHVPRRPGWGGELARAGYSLFAENEIAGVTDGFTGPKWLADRKDGRSFVGRVVELARPGR